MCRGVAQGRPDDQCLVLRDFQLTVCYEMELMHAAQDVELTTLGPVGVRHWVVSRGRLRKPGKHRGFCNIDLSKRLPEVDLRGGRETIGALTQEDLIDVEFQDFIFREAGFNLISK